MPNPSRADVHINRPLTNISTAFIQRAEDFIADQVFPVVPVSKQSDAYFTYNTGDWFRNEVKERAPATESAGGGFDVSTDTYYAKKYAIHMDLDDDIRANQDDPLNLDRDATRWVTQQLMQKKDLLWASSFFKKTVWSTDLDGVSGSPGATEFTRWDVSGSTPIEDVSSKAIAMHLATGMKPNVLVVDPYTMDTLTNHASILERIKYTQSGFISADLIARAMGVDKLLVARAIQDTGNEADASPTLSYIFGKGALLLYVNPTPSLMTPSAGYTFAWTGLMGAGAYGNRINRMRMAPIQSDRVEGEMAFDLKKVTAGAGIYFDSTVS